MSRATPHTAQKVAEVTLGFWVLKICATTLGETAGDLLSMTLGIGYARSSLILFALFLAALTAQWRAQRFHPLLFWAVIVATSTVGTTTSDFLDRTLRLGYATGTSLLAGALVVVLAAWRWSVGSLSVSDVRGPRAEGFYWAAILVSNTLGAYLAGDSGLGFLGGAIVAGSALALIALAAALTRIDRVALFWAAFVLTRPFGATFGDLLTTPVAGGGIGAGTLGASLVLLAILIVGLGFGAGTHAAGSRA